VEETPFDGVRDAAVTNQRIEFQEVMRERLDAERATPRASDRAS